MKICIISFGNKKYGYGHISRSSSLVKVLKSSGDEITKIQNINPFSEQHIYELDKLKFNSYLSSVGRILNDIKCDVIVLDLPFIQSIQ